jgi:acylglycerol lipase
MIQSDGSFTDVNTANIYYQSWLPDEEPKAVLVLVHGLAEHCGRYMNVVNHFVPLGYAIYGLDHIGHGKSDGTRVYVDRFFDFVDTLKTFVDMVKAWQPHTPCFMVGHSMGGLISAAYLLAHQADLDGAVLSAPAIKVPDEVSSTTIMAGKLLSSVAPKFGVLQLDMEGVSQDPAVVEAYVNDPLVHSGKTTARLSAEMLKTMQLVASEAGSITLPILILQGTVDKLVDPEGAQILYDAVSSQDKTLEFYEGFYHEVFNEPGRNEVLGDVQTWLDARVV